MPDALAELASRFGTPLYVQDLDPIQGRVDELHAFDVVRYAVKANPSLAVLRAMRAAGAVVDCVSEGEIRRALAAGFEPEEITFTSDLFERRTLDLVASSGVNVNLGSSDMIEQYAQADARREITIRVNPGFGHGHNQRVNTGGPARNTGSGTRSCRWRSDALGHPGSRSPVCTCTSVQVPTLLIYGRWLTRS